MGRIIFSILSACGLLALGDPLPVAATPAAEEQIDPQDITIAIKAELLVDDHVPHERITVKLQDGIVTLDGAVETLLAKRRAVNLVETIRGVHGIVDRITVAPAAEFSDTELVARVTNALANDPATADLRLRVTSRNGTVTLAGKVDSHQEKHLSEMVAAGVQGVQTVTNELTVVHRPRTGDDIEADIVRRWEADPWIDESLLGLIVDQGGSVSLTGTVGSLDEKRRATQDAWVAGVTQVDATGLKVQWWARHPMRRTVTNGRRSDEQITRAIQSALQYDPRTKRFPIEVAVSDRIVTLSGQVPNLDAKRAATSDAEHTTGVQRVLNHLEVVQVSQPPDPDIQRRVTRALLEDPFLKETRIGVHVEAGTVHLSGTVHSLFDKVRAETIAARATGVLAVRNNLSTLSPRTDKRDAVIRKDIQERIRWNPYLYGKNITVGVEDGVATLFGSVYSLAESQMATQKAYEGGALHVRNRLSIAETQFSKPIE